MNKANMNTNIIGISGFQNGINRPFSSTGFYFMGKTVGNVKMLFFSFWASFLKMCISSEVVNSFLT